MSVTIKQTKDYSQFKYLDSNRDVMPIRVDELIRSIKERNKLHLHPIIVAKDPDDGLYLVTDGQHRLAAAKALKLPIYYVVDEDSELRDIIILNTNRHNWALKDYVFFHHQNGNEEFTFIWHCFQFTKQYHAAFTLIYNTLPIMCTTQNMLKFADMIRMGTIKIEHKDEYFNFLKTTAPQCNEINKLIKKAHKKNSPVLFFKSPYMKILALCFRIMTEKEYEELWLCLIRDYKNFSDTNSSFEVTDMFSRSYNLRKSTNKFDFSKIRMTLHDK